MRKRPIVVEFFGFPGVGKTTISTRVAELLRSKGTKVDSPTHDIARGQARFERLLRKLPRIGMELSRRPLACTRSALAIWRTQQASWKDFVKVLVNWWFVASLLRTNNSRTEIRVLDQGTCQALWMIALKGQDVARLLQCDEFGVGRGCKMHVIVLVEAGVESVLGRLSGRKSRRSRIEQAAISEQSELVLRGLDLYDHMKHELLQSLASLRDVTVVVVRNEMHEDAEKCAASVIRNLQRVSSMDFGAS